MIKCSICNGAIKLTDDIRYDSNWCYQKWQCTKCHVTGEILYPNLAPIKEYKDNSQPNKIVENNGTFWISLIRIDDYGKPFSVSFSEAYLSLAEAKKVIKKTLDNYGKSVIAIWVEHHDPNGKKIDIPFHEVYIDVIAARRKINTDSM